MEEAGIYDLAVDGVKKRYGLFREELVRRNKGKKPFRMEPVDNDTLLGLYNRLTPERMDDAVATHGVDAVEQRLMELEKLKQRRGL